MNILVIIPARGGSKGIPRKNLRNLNGKPLIYYAISNALASKHQPDVYLTSEDDEILHIAAKFNAKTYKRPETLSDDKVTLDPVIYNAYQAIAKMEGKTYELIVTFQPTSPLLKTSSLDAALDAMIQDASIDTAISVINDTHLAWKKENGKAVPDYVARLNRQQLPATYKETGAFLITRNSIITENNRIGQNVHLAELAANESIDIDNYADWAICDYFLKKQHLLFVLSGYPAIGLGHVYNCLILANEILNHKITFLVDKQSELAYQKIAESNYDVHIQQADDILEDIMSLKPDVVINDRLDTDKVYIQSLKAKGLKVINFEDLGEGAHYADMVFNAIYPEKEELEQHYFGAPYFCAREEFILTEPLEVKEKVSKVIVTFGGVDPNNLTLKTLDAIHDFCVDKGIAIHVVTGLGYTQYETLEQFTGISVHKNVKNISDYMKMADIAFSSAGRTIYELAAIGVPSIIMAQNERELTHFFASAEHGFLHLGLGTPVTASQILEAFTTLYDHPEQRKAMHHKMLQNDIRTGKQRVIKLIQALIETTAT